MLGRIRKVSIILMCSVLAGTLLLILIFMLPVENARRHAAESLYEMVEVMEDPAGSPQRKRIVDWKENYTDTLMVQNALEKVEGKSLLEHAMYVYHHDLGGEENWRTEESLCTFLRQGTEGMYLMEYSRYWHGYLVILKPLLMCMSWRHVEILLIAVHAILLLATVLAAFFKKKAGLGIGILLAFLYMKPLRIWVSLAMSVCWLITLAAVLAILLLFDRIEEKKRWEEFFLSVGIVTAYMDFLTYPVVALGLPFCVWLVQSFQPRERGREVWRKAFWNCVCWICGYIGMWGMKWVMAEITCHTGTLRDGAWAVIRRTSPLDGYGSAFTGISRTFSAVLEQYDSVFYGIGVGVVACGALLTVILCLVKTRSVKVISYVGCLAAAALFPVGWLVLTQNHTAIHCIFTFRIMGVSVMALWCISYLSLSIMRKWDRYLRNPVKSKPEL